MNKKLLNKVMKKLASSNVVISPTVKSSSTSLSMQKKPETEQVQQKLEQYLLSRYHFRFNLLTEQTECCKKDADTPIYKVISQRTLNSLCLEARARHINCWDKDVSRFVNSEQMPDYHPLLSYMDALPEWDGMDRVTPLAQRISTKDLDAKEAELANLQLKAEDSSTDPEVEEKLRKRNGELQGKVIELNKQVKSLRRDLDDQAKDKEELQRQLEENSNQPESHDLSAEELQNYLLTLPEFENVTTRHNTDGIIVDAVCGEKNYHFRFDSLPCYEISVPRRETKNLKEVIYQMNAEMPEYKASYDEYEKAAVLTGWYDRRISAEELVELTVDASRNFK